MTKTRIVDNRNRPAQPEPDEDPALNAPPIREQGTRPTPKSDEEDRAAEESLRRRRVTTSR